MIDILKRLLTLLKEDKILHDAVVDYLDSLTLKNAAYAKWRLSKIEFEEGL